MNQYQHMHSIKYEGYEYQYQKDITLVNFCMGSMEVGVGIGGWSH